VSTEVRAEAAARLYWAFQQAVEDRQAGREYRDLLELLPEDLEVLYVDGPGPAILTVLKLVDVAVEYGARRTGREPQSVARLVCNNMLAELAPDAERIGVS
jgi:hypothetical protein